MPTSPKSISFLLIIITYSISPSHALSNCLSSPDIRLRLRTDSDAIRAASTDYGNLVQRSPRAVLHPSSLDDVVQLIKLSNDCPTPFSIAARGRGHSVRGQAAAHGGVVVDMASLSRQGSGITVSWDPCLGHYADVGGEQLWIDVLRAGLEHGLAPVSWTDYLYLSVGGTLSNGGISGQSSMHGPQISNVLELDVITGKGDLLTCSKDLNSDLFFAVLGGLGQFGIITRARIALDKAPTRARWMRFIYKDFSRFTRDQEHLISLPHTNYVEGSLITDNNHPNWRTSSFYSSNETNIRSLLKSNGGLLYSLELVKYYTPDHNDTIDQEVELMVKDLGFVPGFALEKDVPLMEFLNRVGSMEKHEEEKEEEAHPWLNLFLPKSRILDFNAGVFLHIIRRHNKTSGPILFYPLLKQKWDDRMSAVVPEEEEIFYTLGLLHSTKRSASQSFDNLNKQILEFCENNGIKIKQYLPHYESKEDWMKHFGSKWDTFQKRKAMFDPKMILSPGQTIFNTVMDMDYGM